MIGMVAQQYSIGAFEGTVNTPATLTTNEVNDKAESGVTDSNMLREISCTNEYRACHGVCRKRSCRRARKGQAAEEGLHTEII